jgi:hypothetical protein
MNFHADQSRDALRAGWRTAWQRHRERAPLEPLQAQIVDVIELHPEYHALVADEAATNAEFTPEGGQSNPFLHMGLHLALREQVGTDRPAGIRTVYQRLAARAASLHDAEHRMIEVLATVLWDAQRAGRAPDEQAYLEQLRRL